MIKIAIVVCLAALVSADAEADPFYTPYIDYNHGYYAYDSGEAQAVFSCDYGDVHAKVEVTSIQILCEELDGSEKTFRCKNDEDLRLVFKKEGGRALVACSK